MQPYQVRYLGVRLQGFILTQSCSCANCPRSFSSCKPATGIVVTEVSYLENLC